MVQTELEIQTLTLEQFEQDPLTIKSELRLMAMTFTVYFRDHSSLAPNAADHQDECCGYFRREERTLYVCGGKYAWFEIMVHEWTHALARLFHQLSDSDEYLAIMSQYATRMAVETCAQMGLDLNKGL